MPKISVIVPVYKVEPYIHRCIDSILLQSFTDFELILVDDGSPDNCGKICDEYAIKDNRIYVIHQDNGGLSAARNTGIDWVLQNSNSEWIAFIDSDDWVHPDYLKVLYYSAVNNNSNISYCKLFQTEDWILHEYSSLSSTTMQINEQLFNKLFYIDKDFGSYAPGKLIRKEIIKNVGYFSKGRIYEDSAIMCKYFYEAKIVTEIPLYLYYYFINTSGITKSTYSYKQHDILWTKEIQLEFYNKIEYMNMLKVVLTSYILSAANSYRLTITELKDKKTARKILKKMVKVIFLYYNSLSLNKSNFIYVLQNFTPKIADIYWLILSITNKIINKLK